MIIASAVQGGLWSNLTVLQMQMCRIWQELDIMTEKMGRTQKRRGNAERSLKSSQQIHGKTGSEPDCLLLHHGGGIRTAP
jgi:hypothetical protein